MSVIVVGIVPIGLFLASSVAYAMGALRLAGKRVLVKRLSAVESLRNVDVLCLDKSGTLTTNTLVLEKVHPLGIAKAELRRLLALCLSQRPRAGMRQLKRLPWLVGPRNITTLSSLVKKLPFPPNASGVLFQ